MVKVVEVKAPKGGNLIFGLTEFSPIIPHYVGFCQWTEPTGRIVIEGRKAFYVVKKGWVCEIAPLIEEEAPLKGVFYLIDRSLRVFLARKDYQDDASLVARYYPLAFFKDEGEITSFILDEGWAPTPKRSEEIPRFFQKRLYSFEAVFTPSPLREEGGQCTFYPKVLHPYKRA
ncbi:MAG: hypothetical protein QXE75_05620 [Sulfolobales archaeon]